MKAVSFNSDWSFYKKNHEKEAVLLSLPHDAMIHEQRDPQSAGGSDHAFFPGGVYEYEKKFQAPQEWEDQCVFVRFEGVYKNSTVWLNGEKICERPYGYVPFLADLTDHLHYGEENVLHVEADNSRIPNSRWYSGAGIYRPVSLIVGRKTHISWEGVKITTLSYHPARIQIETQIESRESAKSIDPDASVQELAAISDQKLQKISVQKPQNASSQKSFAVSVEILDHGHIVAEGAGTDVTLTIPDAKLWNEDTPYLYQCHVVLRSSEDEADILDESWETFGIRLIEWNQNGLFINGRETLLRGGCVHHDNGILGACAYPEAEERRVRIMKENGFNAIRSAHNPCSDAMAAACDKYGVFLMDETFDMWYMGKTRYDYHLDFEKWWKKDVRAMVERDYNHPSVILLSIGNEVSEPAQPRGVQTGRELIDYIHSLDATRPVTCGTNLMIIKQSAGGKGIYKDVDANQEKQSKASGNESRNVSLLFNTLASFIGTGMNKAANSDKADKLTSPFLDLLDIAGYNYASGRYRMEGNKHPGRLIVGSETFPQDIAKNWAMVKELPYLLGDFMWAGWDYLGEAGIGAWSYEGGLPFARPYPWILGGSGVIDILGNPDVSCCFAQVVWGKIHHPVIGVQPVNHPGKRPTKSVWRGTNALESWSWHGCEGNKAVVEVYSEGTSVELFLNDKSLGRKKLKDFKAVYHVRYQPGTLRAVSYDGNRTLGSHELHSAAAPISIHLSPEDAAANDDIIFVPITLADQNGNVECNADCDLHVEVEGGELLGLGSATPRTEQRYDGNTFRTYYGRLMAVVRRKYAEDETGNPSQAAKLRITVRGDRLKDASIEI